MTFKDYLIVMSIASVAAWMAWLVVFVSTDPSRAGLVSLTFFYLTLAIALVGTLSIIGAGIRTWRKKDEVISRNVTRSLRQAILFTSLLIISLILLSAELFTWWIILLVMLILTLIELAFLSSSRQKRSLL